MMIRDLKVRLRLLLCCLVCLCICSTTSPTQTQLIEVDVGISPNNAKSSPTQHITEALAAKIAAWAFGSSRRLRYEEAWSLISTSREFEGSGTVSASSSRIPQTSNAAGTVPWVADNHAFIA
eukprot:scaffold1339_cov207-Alexandrium_tamarense.AAC.4